MPENPSKRNRSIRLDTEDRERLAPALEYALALGSSAAALRDAATSAPEAGQAGFAPRFAPDAVLDRIISGDAFLVLPRLPLASIDLLLVDPPYNMRKNFGTERGKAMNDEAYEAYTATWLDLALPLLKPGASVYVFGDWRGSSALYRALSKRLEILNRVVWEREKGRAASSNWKNAHEEIWFAALPGERYFDAEAVRVRKRVKAPYRDLEGKPKDWVEGPEGNYRDTAASNIWTDLTVPYWSMPENTPHPTQKPEKLIAKLILASCRPGGLVLDPFLGSGTSAVAAKKLGRRFIGIEADPEHCLCALRRLELAEAEPRIQGYEDGVFYERNEGSRRR